MNLIPHSINAFEAGIFQDQFYNLGIHDLNIRIKKLIGKSKWRGPHLDFLLVNYDAQVFDPLLEKQCRQEKSSLHKDQFINSQEQCLNLIQEFNFFPVSEFLKILRIYPLKGTLAIFYDYVEGVSTKQLELNFFFNRGLKFMIFASLEKNRGKKV